jgi:capsular polysaccharide transport system permease protein
MMARPPAATRDRSSSGWAARASSQGIEPTVVATGGAAGPPVPTDGRDRIAVFPGASFVDGTAHSARRRRSKLRLLSFVAFVVIPVALAAAYYFYAAADQYVAEFRFAVRSVEPVRSETSAIFQGSITPSPIGVDSYAIVQYLASRDIVDDLGKTIDLREMFSRTEADWLTRLELPVSVEELVRYWKNQVDAFFDATNGTIVVRARAFTPDDAYRLAQGVLAASERLVNDLSARARRDTLRNSEKEVRRAERRLKTALARLQEFRDKEGIIDPRKTADATQALAGRVRDELIRADTELATLKHYMRTDAPSIKMLEARVQSLQSQRRSVESEVTDHEKSRSEALSRTMGLYERLESERTFAEKAYQHALEALDRSRMNADRQQVYIAGFVQPSLPEESLYPRRLRSVGVVFILCFAVWGIGSITVKSVRDHL